jgi:hypothetical protein
VQGRAYLSGVAFLEACDHPKHLPHRITRPMNDPQFQQHGGPHLAHRPHWKRVHHSPFFWIAAIFILLAMTVYVVTGNLSFRPGRARKNPVPALAP